MNVKNDLNTTIKELKDKVGEFIHERNWEKYHNPKDIAESICIEAAELLEIFQWRTVEEVLKWREDQLKTRKIAEEIADIVIYVLSMANTMGVDVTNAILSKLLMNREKYPIKKYYGKAYPDN